jgi:UDP-N-acetylglucosamine 2-epimerase
MVWNVKRSMRRLKVITIVGTRPEAIKMAPVIRELKRQASVFEHLIVATAQHREMLDQVLSAFSIQPDIDLGLMQRDQDLLSFASRALSHLSKLLTDVAPDAVLIQGDTTTVMTAALAASYKGVCVGHVEAGLRSFDRSEPFPEEINRRVVGCLADLHFAPTERARANLLREGVADGSIFVTGNTIVDALRSVPLEGEFEDAALNLINFASRRVLLVTAHRRENHGAPLRSICRALKAIVERFGDVEVVYPVHLNPNVGSVVRDELEGTDRVHLVEPVSYQDLLRVMDRSYLILTDSGGIQEEAPSFGKPVLVLRQVTERPEVIEAGAGKLVGTGTLRILDEATLLLSDQAEYERMSRTENPFGDGHAAERIVSLLAEHLRRSSQPIPGAPRRSSRPVVSEGAAIKRALSPQALRDSARPASRDSTGKRALVSTRFRRS